MAESSKSSGKFKQLFGRKSDSDKGSKKKRRKGQKQSATDTEKTPQNLSQIEQRTAVIQGGPRAEDGQDIQQNLPESAQETSANEVGTHMIDQQSLTEQNTAETATDDSKQRDENGDQDLNESSAKLTLESASKNEKEGEDQNVLESEDQPKTSKRGVMAGLSLRRSKKNSKESSKSTRTAVQEKQEEKAIEGTEIPATGEPQTVRNEGDTGEEQAKKHQVKTELATDATVELEDDLRQVPPMATAELEDDLCQVPPEGVTRKKSTDKGHKGKGLKQFASFGRKKKAVVTAKDRKNSKEDKFTGVEQSQSNEDSSSLESSQNDKGTTKKQEDKSSLETGSHQAYDSKPVKEESEETEKDKDDREQSKQATKLSAKKSNSFTKKSKKKQPKGEELGTSSERNSVSNDDENMLESSGKEYDKTEEHLTTQSDPQSKSTEAFASHRNEMIPTGPGNMESDQSKNTISATKKQKKESGLRRQLKKFMSPNKDEDRDKKDGKAKEEDEEQGAGKSDSLEQAHEEGLNASEEKDQPSTETENTKTLERKKSGPLSQALKTKTSDKEEEQVSGDGKNKSVAETGDQKENEESHELTKIKKEQDPQGFDENEPRLNKKEDETTIDKQDQKQAEKADMVEGEETKEFAGKEEIFEKSPPVDAHAETQEQKNSTSGEQRNTQSQDHNTSLDGDERDETTTEAQEKSEKMMKSVDDEMFVFEAKKEPSKTEESDDQREKSQEQDKHDKNAAQVEQNALNTEEDERAVSLDENIPGDKAEHSNGEKCTSEVKDETVKPAKRKTSPMEEKSRELKRLKETDDDDAQNYNSNKGGKLEQLESEDGKEQRETEHKDGLTSEVYTERQDQASEQGMKSPGNEEKATNEENRSHEADTKQAYEQLVTIATPKDTDASDTGQTPTANEQQDEKGTEVDKDIPVESEQNEDLTKENSDTARGEEETGSKKSQDPSASIENSVTDASQTPKEEWIMINALDIPRGISRQLKPYLLLDERTTTCCTIM